MIVIGLTGSIGMGKSTLGRFFAARGAALLDADALVHRLYRGVAVAPVGAAFPDAVREGFVDRVALSAEIARRPEALAEIEAIVHPLVRAEQTAWLDRARSAGRSFALLSNAFDGTQPSFRQTPPSARFSMSRVFRPAWPARSAAR